MTGKHVRSGQLEAFLPRPLVGIIRWLVALAMPVLIILLALRIVWNPWYVHWEYGKPDFPPDMYGFTNAQRIEYVLQWIDYYNSDTTPEQGLEQFLALRLPGTDQPLYLPNEISHMLDVRLLTDTLWSVLVVAAVIVVGGLLLLLIRRETRRDGYAAIFMGGLISTILLVAAILFVLLSWRTFFVALHNVFFPPGTWTFAWESTLIRIFPDRFWFDAGILLVGGSLVTAIVVTFIGYLLGRRARAQGEINGR
jgi:integral membrane protein (TIGR01906 family)